MKKKNEIDEYLKEGKSRGKKLDHYKMLEEIAEIVETDFCSEMEMKSMPKSGKYTQEEALEMSHLLGNVYLIAHCIHCRACQGKYLKVLPN